MLELSQDPAIIFFTEEVSELTQDVLVLPWIEISIVCLCLQILELEEQTNKLLVARNFINIDSQNGFKSLEAFGELAHGTIVNGVPVELVLLSQDLSVSLNDVLSILLKQVENSDVKLFVSLDGLSVMEH